MDRLPANCFLTLRSCVLFGCPLPVSVQWVLSSPRMKWGLSSWQTCGFSPETTPASWKCGGWRPRRWRKHQRRLRSQQCSTIEQPLSMHEHHVNYGSADVIRAGDFWGLISNAIFIDSTLSLWLPVCMRTITPNAPRARDVDTRISHEHQRTKSVGYKNSNHA